MILRLIWRAGNLKIKLEQLQNYYKIYCNKTLNIKNRMFKDFSEFSFILTRVGMEKCLRDFNRKTCNVSKIYQQAKFLLAFGDKNSFADIDPDNVIKPCETLEASLRIMKNKNIDEILERN